MDKGKRKLIQTELTERKKFLVGDLMGIAEKCTGFWDSLLGSPKRFKSENCVFYTGRKINKNKIFVIEKNNRTSVLFSPVEFDDLDSKISLLESSRRIKEIVFVQLTLDLVLLSAVDLVSRICPCPVISMKPAWIQFHDHRLSHSLFSEIVGWLHPRVQ